MLKLKAPSFDKEPSEIERSALFSPYRCCHVFKRVWLSFKRNLNRSEDERDISRFGTTHTHAEIHSDTERYTHTHRYTHTEIHSDTHNIDTY